MNTSRNHRSAPVTTRGRLRSLLATLTVAILASMIGFAGATAAAPVVEDHAESQAELASLGMAYHLVDAVLNRQDAVAAAELISEDAVIHTADGDYVGPQGLLDYVTTIRRVYPAAHFEVTNISFSHRGLTVEWTMYASWYQVDPSEPPLDVTTEISTAATITIDGSQITAATFENAEVAVGAEAPVAGVPNRGQPF